MPNASQQQSNLVGSCSNRSSFTRRKAPATRNRSRIYRLKPFEGGGLTSFEVRIQKPIDSVRDFRRGRKVFRRIDRKLKNLVLLVECQQLGVRTVCFSANEFPEHYRNAIEPVLLGHGFF